MVMLFFIHIILFNSIKIEIKIKINMQSFLLYEDFKKNNKKPFILIGLAILGFILSFVIGNKCD
jgi:hypothetical protein